MNIIHHEGSLNFIDENDVFLGFREEQMCCEKFLFNLAYDQKMKKEISFYDLKELSSILNGYFFNTSYCVMYYDQVRDAKTAVFKLEKENEEDIFIFLSNRHNGYYSHRFNLSQVSMEYFEEYYKDNTESEEEGLVLVDLDSELSDDLKYLKAKYAVSEAITIQTFFSNHV